jgi:steroid 5-alpha reductase family enzyme
MSSTALYPTFRWPVQFCIATTVTCYFLSLITGNVSQVDRVWTFLPAIYTAYWALLPLWPSKSLLLFWPNTPQELPLYLREQYSPRALLMLSLVVLWMFRLSYNTWRRGLFYLNDEDYRWAVLRQKVPAWLFQLTNLTFISIAQNIILFLLGLPTHTAVIQPHTPLGISDYTLFLLGLLTLACEFTADNQQYSFQTYKHNGHKHAKNEWPGAQIRWTEEDAKRGFVTKGLWAWSRHPNFLCEQTFWIIITAIPLLSHSSPPLATLPLKSMTPLYPILPALVLCLLFFSSTLFTESISRSKYPAAYKMYQERVAMFVPFLTPVWGVLANFRGRKEVLDGALWRKVKSKEKAE